MTRTKQAIGQWGEQMAANFLEQRGYKIIGRNIRTPYGEIDILAQQDSYSIFIEVKTRTSTSLGPPEISVTPRKQQHMLAAAEHFAAEHEIDGWQIDVISVEGKPGSRPRITHFDNAIG